ncbi:hypothetical protein [Dasania marina]|uniref:hypothetical protein n=1 Tax=Dasania marina TaxID=471499 RepID=UPI0030D87DC7|tara:strand:+ start:210 stop:656 length:447 start_codon:yes stop_codon:yes gene_type:complete
MEALYIILGAVLALGGGILTYRVQLKYAQLKEEGGLLFDIEKSLLEIGGIESQLDKIPPDSKNIEELARKQSLLCQKIAYVENLHLLAIRITSNNNRKTAVRVTKFSLDEHFRTEKNRYSLLKEVQESLNSKLLKQYMQEMNHDPNKF